MVAGDFPQNPRVREWLDGVEPAWTLLTVDSLRVLRQPPFAVDGPIPSLAGLTCRPTLTMSASWEDRK
jgi:hypothetical protein